MSAVPIAGDGRETIERGLSIDKKPIILEGEWEEGFEIHKCVDWIKNNSFKKVCLQFPAEYLEYAPKVLSKLEEQTDARCFILADSTYGSCCVDEKTANHVPNAEGIIHFGQSCLSPCKRYKVLYIFTKPYVDLDKMEQLFKAGFGMGEKVVIVYDVIYQHAALSLFQRTQTSHPLLRMSELIIPGDESNTKSNTNTFIKHGRSFPFLEQEAETYSIFYIGSHALPNLLLALSKCTFKVYDPSLPSDSILTQTSTINKLIRKRNFYIEKIKDATSVGILVGTLVVQNYLDVIERLKTIFRKVEKQFYVVSIGEINPCKLGNFMDIDVFVFVGCSEVVNYYISDDSKGQFFQPVVTPYDVELAFCEDDERSLGYQQYVIDWAYLIEKGEPKVKEVEDDVSLITGGLRTRTNIQQPSQDKSSANKVINWVGLDENEFPPLASKGHEIHPGRSGIASSYKDEPIS